jgi:hypothetical protein
MIYPKIQKRFLISSILVFFLIFTVSFTGCIDRGHRELGMDIWVLKTDARGAMEWKTVIDNDPNNRGMEIIQTRNGGYAIAGTGTDVRQNGPVPFIFRLDRNGNIQPDIHLNSTPDYGSSVAEAPDNGNAIASHSGNLTRVSGNGTALWSISLNGGSDWWKVISVPAGGYAVAGGNRVIRINEDGTIAWTNTLEKYRNSSMIIAVPDGGVVTGGTVGSDVWVARLMADGQTVFDKTFSSISHHELYSIRITPAGTYEIIYGSTTHSGNETTDRWVSETTEVSITDDGRQVGAKPVNVSRIITATSDGGYAYSGFAVPEFTEFQPQGYPGSSLQVVKMDDGGNVTLNVQYDIGNYGPVSSIIQTEDGGFAIMGNSYDF